MKGYRFYLEFPDAGTKRKSGRGNKGHSGNVLAVYLEKDGRSYRPIYFQSAQGVTCVEAAGAVQDIPNGSVTFSANPSVGYIQTQCKRIPEELAREIHPKLFEALDMYEK